MPFESILFLALVIAAFILFASVLAYGDWATRQVMREIANSRPSSTKLRETPKAHAVKSVPGHRAAA